MSLKVTCYSGHTFAQRPTAFVWRGRRYQVEQILKRWRSPQGPGFQLVTTEGKRFELTYDESHDEWSLIHLRARPQGEKENNVQLCL